jgi:glutaminase
VRGTTSIYTLFSVGDLAQGKVFQYISRNICGQVFNCIMNVQLMKGWKKNTLINFSHDDVEDVIYDSHVYIY